MKEASPLASNMGKVSEGLLNNRIKDEITMTEAQAGQSTADHINILNSIINQSKRNILGHNTSFALGTM